MCTDFSVYRHRVTAPRPSLPFLQKLILVVQSALSASPPGFWPKSAAILFAVHRPLFIFTLYIPIHYFICRSSLSFIHSSVSARARCLCARPAWQHLYAYGTALLYDNGIIQPVPSSSLPFSGSVHLSSHHYYHDYLIPYARVWRVRFVRVHRSWSLSHTKS